MPWAESACWTPAHEQASSMLSLLLLQNKPGAKSACFKVRCMKMMLSQEIAVAEESYQSVEINPLGFSALSLPLTEFEEGRYT